VDSLEGLNSRISCHISIFDYSLQSAMNINWPRVIHKTFLYRLEDCQRIVIEALQFVDEIREKYGCAFSKRSLITLNLFLNKSE